jgi:predicted DNA binding CopG/RHH family protein
MKKKIPTFKTDEEAEKFVATADLSDYDLSGAQLVRFELKRKDKSVNLRLPEDLLDAVRSKAERAGMPYQRFIRLALERAVNGDSTKTAGR